MMKEGKPVRRRCHLLHQQPFPHPSPGHPVLCEALGTPGCDPAPCWLVMFSSFLPAARVSLQVGNPQLTNVLTFLGESEAE